MKPVLIFAAGALAGALVAAIAVRPVAPLPTDEQRYWQERAETAERDLDGARAQLEAAAGRMQDLTTRFDALAERFGALAEAGGAATPTDDVGSVE